MRIRTIGIIIALAVVAGAIPAIAGHTFLDVDDSNEFHADIAWLAETGITRGCNPPANTEFCPDDSVTRSQMGAFLHRMDAHVLDQAAAGEPGDLARELAVANRAAAGFQDVVEAEAVGYANTIDTLACHENPSVGGMGVHYLNESLLDAVVDATKPEALVYELDADGEIAGLVAHEYVVPVEAWTSPEPPMLFGQEFTVHPVLPLWKLHAWIWKDNPLGTFTDFNPKVRLCPDGVPVFGE